MILNTKFSYQDFMNLRFVYESSEAFNFTVIKCSNFYQESLLGDRVVMKSIFPVDIEGVVFDQCNLDNVIVPSLCTVMPNCTHRRIQMQNDLGDWFLSSLNKPVEPLEKKAMLRGKISVNPLDLPSVPLTYEEFALYRRVYLLRQRLADLGDLGSSPVITVASILAMAPSVVNSLETSVMEERR